MREVSPNGTLSVDERKEDFPFCGTESASAYITDGLLALPSGPLVLKNGGFLLCKKKL